MKLGLYGGGFKPFHTGHFAKLLLALDEAGEDGKVISFFGIKKQKFSKKTGNPLKTNFRKFGDGPNARSFNQEMQEEIVSIYEDALESAFPGKLDIVPSADEPPLTKIFNILNNFAYQNMTEEERERLSEDIPNISGGQNLKDFDMNNVEEIVVVTGPEELNKTYISGINRQAEKSEIGKKIKELIESGRIRFETGEANQQRLVDLLSRYREGASEDHILVRGTDVRNLAANKDVESLLRYIPNIVDEKEREQIVKILIGDKSQKESFFMPIITDSTVLRAAARFTVNKNITEASRKKKGEDHIPGLTEDMSLTFDNLKSLISDVLSGRVSHVEEKMDGQNFTFTVLDNGEIRLFGKGVSETTLKKGGIGREDIRDHQRWNENVKDAFGSGYDVVSKLLEGKDIDLIKRLFQNGKVVVEGQVMTPVNPNTIPYTENHVRFIRPFTPYDIEIDQDSYRDIFIDTDIEIQDEKGREWSLGPVPKLQQVNIDAEEMSVKIQELQGDIDSLLGGMEPVPQTVGEYAARVLEEYIARVAPQLDLDGLNSDQRRRALQRLATGDKQIIGKPEMGTAWSEFQKFEKMRTAHVAAAIADLEKIVQKLGSYFFDTLEFALATNEGVVADLADEVKKIKNARDADQIRVMNVDSGEISDMIDTNWATKLDTSLARVEQMDLFKKAVEGVVLRLPGENGQQIVTKLTGMFTPVHRLVSLFRYPDRSTRSLLSIQVPDVAKDSTSLTDDEIDAINEVLIEFATRLGFRNILSEAAGGGNAFKNAQGDKLATEIEKANIEPTITHFYSNHLTPLGFGTYNYQEAEKKHHLGSTGKKDSSGDIDIVLQIPAEDLENNRGEFKNNLISNLNRSLTDGQAKASGAGNIAVLYPIQGTQLGEYVQIDIMPSVCAEHTCWQMAGVGEGEIRGEYRNKLMGHLAKRISQDPENEMYPNEKITISSPGGVNIKRIKQGVTGHPHSSKNKRKWENIGQVLSDPIDQLSALGLDLSPEESLTFVQIADKAASDPRLRKYLSAGEPGEGFERMSFEEYIANDLTNPGKAEEARKAVDYINSILSTSAEEAGNINESEIRDIIRKILEEGSGEGGSSFPFSKIAWSDKLKIFSYGKWNLWNERVSATADGGKDPEGAEKAVAAMENLIYLSQNGYSVLPQDDGGVLIQGKGINAKLDANEAVEYIIGIRTSRDEEEPKLPDVRIRHVAGTKPYDLELASTGVALEVKKMGGKDRLSKLGSATGRIFDRHVKIIRPLRSAGQIAQKLIEGGLIVSEDGEAIVRGIKSPPEGFDIDAVANAVEMIDYFFNRLKFGRAKSELPGVMIKIEGGQIGAGMIRRIKRDEILDIPDRGNIFEACKTALNNTLGEYSPGKERSAEPDTDGVDITASTGSSEYEGSVSLDYFYDELIYRLFDTGRDGKQIDEDLLTSYVQSIELISQIYAPLSKINNNQGEDVFDKFIDDLHYGGFYGVASDHYYSIPCDSNHLYVYSTTQGFRAVLAMKSIPPEGSSIQDIKVKNPPDEEEVDLEVDLVDSESETDSDDEEVEIELQVGEEEIDTEDSDKTNT